MCIRDRYTEVLNSDSHYYGGSGGGNGGIELIAEERPWMENPYSICLTVPPLGGIVLRPDPLPQPEPIEASAELEAPAETQAAVAGAVEPSAEEAVNPSEVAAAPR